MLDRAAVNLDRSPRLKPPARGIQIRSMSPLVGWVLAAPAAISMAIFIVLPLLAVIVISLSNWQLGQSSFSFTGFANFERLLSDPLFARALGNTILYAAIVIPGSIVLGLAVALLIEGGERSRAIYQTIHFLPVLATIAALALSWEALLNPFIGVANVIVGLFGFPPQNWLSDPRTTIPTLAVIGIWQHFGFCMVLFIAGIRTIPHELYEASSMDGADGFWDRFVTVIWPLLGPVTLFVSILVALRAFEVFDTVAVLTQGGPADSSQVLMYSIFTEAFQFLRTGYAAAITVVFLAILLVLTSAQLLVGERRVHYS
jgi:multiple sugar transport system permease protein